LLLASRFQRSIASGTSVLYGDTDIVDVMAKPHKAPEVRRHKGLKARRYKAVADCAAKTPFNSQN